MQISKGDHVINKNQIESITSLINGDFTVNFQGPSGIITGIDEAQAYSTVKYDDEVKREFIDDLILIKAEVE